MMMMVVMMMMVGMTMVRMMVTMMMVAMMMVVRMMMARIASNAQGVGGCLGRTQRETGCTAKERFLTIIVDIKYPQQKLQHQCNVKTTRSLSVKTVKDQQRPQKY